VLRRLGLEPNVRVLGSLDQEELCRYYAAADVCAMPSLYESFGLVALEAQACGCPVVASGVGGLRYVVVGGETGFHVPPEDDRALADSLALVLLNRHLARRLGDSGAKRVRRDFLWPIVAHRVAEVYDSTIEDSRRLVVPA